ncbi:putative RNA-directed DNA polymerase, eukaryota, reverse transcriptase zinc-binding domain protein [Tanacetum coccineum]
MIAPLQNHLECLTMRMVDMIPQCQVGSRRQETKAMLTLSLGRSVCLNKREEWLLDLYQLDQLHCENLKQKGRFRWAVKGDENSKFFHSILNFRCAYCSIKGVHVDEVWVDSPENIKAAALNYFDSRFKEKVKGVVWDCTMSKAPGPDDFNLNFIKSFWDVIKVDFWNFLLVVSKLLSSRLARVINSIISHNQSDFISGRQILDGCLIANEIIQMASLEDKKLLLFKVDFEKAFNTVNWNFLLSIMRQMGFEIKWRNRIASCLSSASILVLINGSPSKEFKMKRDLRQDDPLLPFLFLLVAEALQVTIVDACNKGIFKGVFWRIVGLMFLFFQFFDDALFFGEWSRLNASNLIRILNCFEMSSGLKVNLDKSRIFGIGIPSSEIESVATSLGYPKFGGLGVGCLLSKNLGLLGKWKWRFLTEKHSLWRSVIKKFYGEYGGFNYANIPPGNSGIWMDILKAIRSNEDIDTNFKSSFVRKVISGDNTAFWHDPCFVVMV